MDGGQSWQPPAFILADISLRGAFSDWIRTIVLFWINFSKEKSRKEPSQGELPSRGQTRPPVQRNIIAKRGQRNTSICNQLDY